MSLTGWYYAKCSKPDKDKYSMGSLTCGILKKESVLSKKLIHHPLPFFLFFLVCFRFLSINPRIVTSRS